MNKKLSFFLFLIILISGYASLALELIAMRQVVPYIGNDTIISSIIIGIILVSLSLGYYTSGSIKISKQSIRDKIMRNFIISLFFIFLGTSYVFVGYYFSLFVYFGIINRIVQAFAFSIIFLAVPSYLLAQTTPLLSNFFSKNLSGEMTGKMLMFGTFGSFAGSIFTTLFIMPIFGVSYAVFFNIFLMALTIAMLSRKRKINVFLFLVCFLVVVFLFNNRSLEKQLNILSNNEYSTIKIIDTDEGQSKVMMINNSFSSKISSDYELMFPYIKYIEENFIFTIPSERKLNILVLGAGGFTVGNRDTSNNYTFVDIDRSLLDVSEKYFLNKKLESNKKFVAEDARSFLRQTKKKYDLIILDTYSSRFDIPSQLITAEYFESIKNVLTDDGIVVANIIASPVFSDEFSVKLDNTFRAVFKNIGRQIINNFNPWEKPEYYNIIYTYYNNSPKTNKIYTDDNSSSNIFDKGRK